MPPPSTKPIVHRADHGHVLLPAGHPLVRVGLRGPFRKEQQEVAADAQRRRQAAEEDRPNTARGAATLASTGNST